ncbi:hypothetical protein FACS1894208_01170 [Clostridia bacterium]|nr:hypothetical protein FACS1894208_01170 [Clostridia bacterium]
MWNAIPNSNTSDIDAYFDDYGVPTLPQTLNGLTDNASFCVKTSNDTATFYNFSYNVSYPPQTYTITHTTQQDEIATVDEFEISYTITNNAKVMMALSFDGGTTWYSNNLIPIDITDIAADGISVQNGIDFDSNAFRALNVNNQLTIRFYIDLPQSNSTARIDDIKINYLGVFADV